MPVGSTARVRKCETQATLALALRAHRDAIKAVSAEIRDHGQIDPDDSQDNALETHAVEAMIHAWSAPYGPLD